MDDTHAGKAGEPTTTTKKNQDTAKKGQAPGGVRRQFVGDGEILSDRFALLVSDMLKDVSIDVPRKGKRKPIWEKVAHQHQFRNYDSGGRFIDACSPVGGHFHKCEVYVEDGELKLRVSGPLKKLQNADGEIYDAPLEHDHHTHEAVYRETTKVKARKVSEEAAKAMTLMMARQTPKAPAGLQDA